MSWVLWIVGVLGFFYFVGSLTTKKESLGITLSTGDAVTVYKTKRQRYLPWSDIPYHHSHEFKLYQTDAALGWNDGNGDVDVWCMLRFSKGEPTAKVMARYNDSYKSRVWNEAPKPASKECLAEIRETLKLK